MKMKKQILLGALVLASATANATTYDWLTGSGVWTDTGWTTNGVAATPVWDASADAYIHDGTMSLTPSANPGTPIHDVYLKPAGGSSELNLSADLSCRTILLGHDGDSGSATVNQTTGTINTTGYSYIGYKGTSTNTYNLHGGTWNSSGGKFYIGENAGASGTLDIDGGTLDASGAMFALGYYADGSGTLRLDSGTLHHTATGASTYFLVGRSGSANLEMDGGTLESSAQKFALGYYGTSAGTMNLRGGLLRFTGDWFYAGRTGSGSLHQSGGTNETTGLIIADQTGSDGLYSISGGTLSASKYIYLHTANAVFEVDGSGADSIEAGAILASAGTLRFKLDGNGATLMKAVGGYNGRGIELTNATLEVETLAGFNGTAGDTYDLMWTTNGFMTNDMTFANNSSSAFDLEIAQKNGGEVLRLVVPPATTNSLRLFSYNIHHGEGEDNVVDLDRIGDVIEASNPDLVALQEVDKNTTRSGNIDQAQVLGQRFGMEYRFMKTLDYQGGEYGIALLSRYPILSTYSHALPANGGEPRGALEVMVDVPDLYGRTSTVSFVSLHLDHLSDTSRVSQVQTLLAGLASRENPIVLAGDFNARPWENSILLLENNGYAPLDPSAAFTYPSGSPTKKIDYIMTKGLPLSESNFEVVETMASDHRPLLAETFLGAPADWLASHGLAADIAANFADPDGDSMDNYSEWLTGTDPTNALSFFDFQAAGSGPVPTGFQLQWNSTTNRTYRIESSTNLVDGTFQTLENGIQGLEGATEYIDTNANGKAQSFYRVFVE